MYTYLEFYIFLYFFFIFYLFFILFFFYISIVNVIFCEYLLYFLSCPT